MEIIARIYTDFKEKFGIPRQSGIVGTRGKIVFEPKYRNDSALVGITGYSHLWLIWSFSEVKATDWSPTVRPPRLGGNKRMGVFATRSPYRPNPIGLSSVKLNGLEKTQNEGTVIYVEGADILDGTPIFDIKPYLAFTDAHPDAICGFADDKLSYSIKVRLKDGVVHELSDEDLKLVFDLISEDPRPSYQDDSEREYGMIYGTHEIHFTVNCGVATIIKISKM